MKDGASARLEDSKTGPRTIWLGPDAARLVADLPRPEGAERVFPEDLTSDRLYAFWVTIRQDAGLPSLRIHDCRHTWASQGVMNGVGLQTVGRSLGHRKRRSTAISTPTLTMPPRRMPPLKRRRPSPTRWGTGPGAAVDRRGGEHRDGRPAGSPCRKQPMTVHLARNIKADH